MPALFSLLRPTRRRFDDLTAQEVLSLAILAEEEDGRIYAAYAANLADRFPASAAMLVAMAEEENEHRRVLLDLYVRKFGSTINPERVRSNGPDTALNAMQSMGLALAVHELATNATKYGALSNDTGQVDIGWTSSEDGHFLFEWRETGGPPVEASTRKGFGSRLIKDIVPRYFTGRADIEHRLGGIRYELTGSIQHS